jgi:glutamate/tyrosine decarboxylase-like PLP-dependent enzyme
MHPAGLGAEWLVTAWDQNAGLYAPTPGVSVAEQVAGRWLVELLALPSEVGVGFVTGGQMANWTCLAAARHHVLAEAGWDVERDGLQDAPRVTVVAGDERHTTIDRSLRYLGLGAGRLVTAACDDQGRVDAAALDEVLKGVSGPTIVAAQAGNVNTGACDPFGAVADAVDAHRERGNPVWLHVDGAFGLWAAASPTTSHLTAGAERADSWSTDGHKWLNVPYDSGYAFTRHPQSHRGATTTKASYLIQGTGQERDPLDWVPEFSRRARGVATYAVLLALGRSGVAEVIESCCGHARRFAEELAATEGIEIRNDVVLNQVLVRFRDPTGQDDDGYTRAVIERVQEGGEAFFSGTTWRGEALMRISVSDWATDDADVDRAVAAVVAAHTA